MGSRQRGKNSSSFSNLFAALALHEEQEPKKVLQLQSSRHQKKLEYQANKALSGTGRPQSASRTPNPSSRRQQQQQQQQQTKHGTRQPAAAAAAPAGDGSSPESPGFLAALAAIQAVEQQTPQQQQKQQQQHQEHDEETFWPSLPQQDGARGLNSGSLSSSPSNTSSDYSCSSSSAWPSSRATGRFPRGSSSSPAASDSDWGPPAISCSQVYSWRCFAMSFAEAARAAGDEDAAEGALYFGVSHTLTAAAAAAADVLECEDGQGREDGGGDYDPAAAAALQDVAAQAAAAGLTLHELLQAQQEELLLQIRQRPHQRQRKKGPQWRQLSLNWNATSSAANNNNTNSSSNNSSCAASPVRRPAAAPDVTDGTAFPQLEPSSSSSSAGWQQGAKGRSAHAVPRGWKGGRLATPKHNNSKGAKGIKLLHTPNSGRSSAAAADNSAHHSSSDNNRVHFRPTALDLHWDLLMDGLAPMQRDRDDDDSSSGSGSSSTGDMWGVGGAGFGGMAVGRGGVRGRTAAAAAERTRQLLAEQEAAAAAAEGAGGGYGNSSSSRDKLGQDTVRCMMDKAAAAAEAAAAHTGGGSKGASSSSTPLPGGRPQQQQEEGGGVGDVGGQQLLCGGSKASFSYSWSNVFKLALLAGWEPVGKADGGGGSHFKLRRLLPESGVTQTMVIPCTPSDSQRGVRNVASAFKKREEEKVVLESRAVAAKLAAAAAGGGGNATSTAAAAGGSKRTNKRK